jgi:hypothetical protein
MIVDVWRPSMKGDGAIWYLPGQSGQPTGPFTTEDVLAKCKAGDLSSTTFCWRDGMDAWKPLVEVEPFSGVFEPPPPPDDLGKAFNRAIEFTKRKAKTASLRVTLGRHEKHRQQLLCELGEMVYRREHEISLLSQEPCAEKLRQLKTEDESIRSLRRQIESIEKPGSAAAQEDNR